MIRNKKIIIVLRETLFWRVRVADLNCLIIYSYFYHENPNLWLPAYIIAGRFNKDYKGILESIFVVAREQMLQISKCFTSVINYNRDFANTTSW